MVINFSPDMLRSIDIAIERCRRLDEMVDVYGTAEAVQKLHFEDNVALEDIINQVVLRAGANVALGFLPNEAPGETVALPSTGSVHEFLLEDENFISVGAISLRRH